MAVVVLSRCFFRFFCGCRCFFFCLCRDVSNAMGSKRKIQNENIILCLRPGIEPTTPCFPMCRRSNHSAIGTVNGVLSKFLHYFFTLLSIETRNNACMKLMLVRCVLELTVEIFISSKIIDTVNRTLYEQTKP